MDGPCERSPLGVPSSTSQSKSGETDEESIGEDHQSQQEELMEEENDGFPLLQVGVPPKTFWATAGGSRFPPPNLYEIKAPILHLRLSFYDWIYLYEVSNE